MDKKIKRLICPICKSSIEKDGNSFFPFCSSRCKDADLYHWLTGNYKVSRPIIDTDEIDKITDENSES